MTDKERLAEEYENNCYVDCEHGYDDADIKAAFIAGYDAGVKSPEVEALVEAAEELACWHEDKCQAPFSPDLPCNCRNLPLKDAIEAHKARLGKG